jgi:hypothetical protein
MGHTERNSPQISRKNEQKLRNFKNLINKNQNG